MKEKTIFYGLILAGGLLFNYLFFQETPGVNYSIYFLFAIVAGLVIHKGMKWTKPKLAATLCLGTLCLCIGYHASVYTAVVATVFFFIWIGIIAEIQFKSFAHSFFFSFDKLNLASSQISTILPTGKKERNYFKMFGYFLKIVVLPIVLLLVFALAYSFANHEFGTLFWPHLFKVFDFIFAIFDDLSIAEFFFFCFGLLISFWSIIKIKNSRAVENLNFTVIRIKKHRKGKLSMVLKRSFKSALLFLIIINGLTLMFNIVDIQKYWFNFKPESVYQMKSMVHEGTYTLIFSLLLAIVVLLTYFKSNLNFYPNKKVLQIVAYLWIFQNGILLISVFLRTYYYASIYGLAYKRIGVFFFLLATLIGLICLVVKIKENKNFLYMLRVNSISFYLIFFTTACFNWDGIIAKYNLDNFEKLNYEDTAFLLELSDKTLPLLIENKEKFEQSGEDYRVFNGNLDLLNKAKAFKLRMENRNLPSVNYLEAKALPVVEAYLNLEEKRKPINQRN